MVFSFILQSLSPVQKVLLSWATTMAQCLRQIQARHAWNGQSFLIMCSSILAEAWENTITAETLTVNPTPGAFSDKALVPLAGLTVTATRVRQSVLLHHHLHSIITMHIFISIFHPPAHPKNITTNNKNLKHKIQFLTKLKQIDNISPLTITDINSNSKYTLSRVFLLLLFQFSHIFPFQYLFVRVVCM